MYHIIENNMGIHLLNRFLRTKNPKGIKEVHLNTFANKKIAIDISIYLYRYASQDALTENILKMCNLFKSHKIRPLFVFDGKSSDKKQETLFKRKEAKQKAYSQYTILKNDTRFLKNKSRLLRELKRKSTYINIKMINQVKNTLDSCGMSYIVANGEADELCAALAKTNKVAAVLSEDTDMFAYGVPVVLKYFSFVKHTVVMYETNKLLGELNLNYDEFLDICVLSGTDYNKSCGNLFNIYDFMIKYKKNIIDSGELIGDSIISDEPIESFGSWVNNNHLENIQDENNIDEVMNSKKYYKINSRDILKEYPFIIIKSGG
jgi:flap endonuclease-1